MQVKAKVIEKLSPETGVSKSGKEWAKQVVIVETIGEYPKKIALTFFNFDKPIPSVSDIADFHLNVESKEFNGRWFTEVRCWRVEGGI